MNELTRAKNRQLTASEFLGLADVPPELEWFANIRNKQTKRAYQNDVREFSQFIRIATSEEMLIATRTHVIDLIHHRGMHF